MSKIDIGTQLDDLLKVDPAALVEAYSSALGVLEAKVSAHRLLQGPPLPDISPALDQEQREVVGARANTIRLPAPAGAGKTHCIVNRVLALLRDGASHKRILMVTFDTNSANELRGRVHDLLGNQSAPQISTLNAFGLGLLKQYVWQGAAPRLINQTRGYQLRLVKDAFDAVVRKGAEVKAVLPESVKWTYYLQIFSYLKNQLYSPRLPSAKETLERLADTLAPIADTSGAPLLAQVGTDKRRFILLLAALDWLFRHYEREKGIAGYIDFDDQKLLAFEGLQNEAGMRRGVQGLFDHIIVDEFQDLNELDFRLILAVSEKARLLVVGDDDQAIYGFRGTSPKYIIELERLSGRKVTSIELRRNYRSPGNIVVHASALIRRNTYRIPKSPIPHQQEQCHIRVYNALTPSAEASLIGDFIERVVGGSEVGYRDIAVLYRMNSQSLPLQLEFLTRAIPYFCRKEDNILGHEFIPRVLGTLRFVDDVQREEDPSLANFMDAVRAYFRYLSESDANKLLRLARAYGPPFVECLGDSQLAATKVGKSNVGVALWELIESKSPLDALMLLGSRFKGVGGMVGSLEEAAGENVPYGELGDVAMRFPTLGEFVQFLESALERAKTAQSEDFDADSVRLLTYFRSKGAQFDTVILPSLNEGIIPHGRAPIEDERRLFYVAMTRTRRNLWMSYVKRVCNKAVDVSRFVKEAELPAESWR